MPLFKYTALRKGEKESFEDTIEAKDRFEVYTAVRKDDAQVLSVKEISSKGQPIFAGLLGIIQRIKENDKILLNRNIGSMLKAGLSLSRALSVIERQSRNPKLKEVIKDISTNIQQGGSLSSGMLRHPNVFPNIVTSMVAAGEESGTLAETLITIADQLERSYDLKKKIRGAMIYPCVILFVLLGIGGGMMIYIVPSLTQTFRSMEVELPMSTEIIIAISDFLVANTLISILGLAGTVAIFIASMRTYRGKRIFETVFLKIPIIGQLMKETNSARTGRTMSSLLSSGVNMLTSIDITATVVQNSYYKDVLNTAKAQVEKGGALAEVFRNAEHLYPPMVGELIAVGEETGALPNMFFEIATYYENEIAQKTKNMSTIIEPFLMLIVGGAVGFFAISMISPIYSITSSIQ